MFGNVSLISVFCAEIKQMIHSETINRIRKEKRYSVLSLGKEANIPRAKLMAYLEGRECRLTLKEFDNLCFVLGYEIKLMVK